MILSSRGSKMIETHQEPHNGKSRIVLLTGFLGSGKTTLLKRILSWDEDLSDTAVIVNELGEVGIDGDLLKGATTDVIELTSGCVCCTMKADLGRSLRDVWLRFHPKRILIEATGVAEPSSVASVLDDEDLAQWMALQKVITVLDIRFWTGREKFGPFFMSQAEEAGLILLNKVDTVEESTVKKCLKEMHDEIPNCHAVPTTYCEIDPEIVWADHDGKKFDTDMLKFYPSLHVRDIDQGHDHDHHHDNNAHHGEEHGDYTHTKDSKGFVAFHFIDNKPLDEARFNAFLKDVPWELFRIKGPVRFSDGTVLLNFVAGTTNWENWDGDKRTRLVFVGWRINAGEIIQRLKTCVQE